MPTHTRLALIRSRAVALRAQANATPSPHWRGEFERQAFALEREAATIAAAAVLTKR